MVIILNTLQLPPELSRDEIEKIPVPESSPEERLEMMFQQLSEEEQVELNISSISKLYYNLHFTGSSAPDDNPTTTRGETSRDEKHHPKRGARRGTVTPRAVKRERDFKLIF